MKTRKKLVWEEWEKKIVVTFCGQGRLHPWTQATLMGRWRQVRGTRKISLTQNLPQREMPGKVPRGEADKHELKWESSKDELSRYFPRNHFEWVTLLAEKNCIHTLEKSIKCIIY